MVVCGDCAALLGLQGRLVGEGGQGQGGDVEGRPDGQAHLFGGGVAPAVGYGGDQVQAAPTGGVGGRALEFGPGAAPGGEVGAGGALVGHRDHGQAGGQGADADGQSAAGLAACGVPAGVGEEFGDDEFGVLGDGHAVAQRGAYELAGERALAGASGELPALGDRGGGGAGRVSPAGRGSGGFGTFGVLCGHGYATCFLKLWGGR